MRSLKIDIECGATTCASEPGKFCKFVSTRKFGTVPFCQIWGEQDWKGKEIPLKEKDGWLQRRQECLDAEAENEKD